MCIGNFQNASAITRITIQTSSVRLKAGSGLKSKSIISHEVAIECCLGYFASVSKQSYFL